MLRCYAQSGRSESIYNERGGDEWQWGTGYPFRLEATTTGIALASDVYSILWVILGASWGLQEPHKPLFLPHSLAWAILISSKGWELHPLRSHFSVMLGPF